MNPAVPEKPSLERLEEKWTTKWEAELEPTGSTASESIRSTPALVSGDLHPRHSEPWINWSSRWWPL